MSQPFFTVVIPLYNKEAYIGRTLDSVLAQTFGEFEVLVVNDGSADGSAGVVRGYESRDARVRLLDKVNGGVSSARNFGIGAASGSYVAFIDADDWWDNNHLAELHALAQEFPQAGMLSTAYARHMAGGRSSAGLITTLVGKRGLVPHYFDIVRQYQFVCSSCVAVALPVLRAMTSLFPEQARNGEDLDMWMRIAIAHPVAFSGVVTAHYDCNVAAQATKTIGNSSAASLYPLLTIGQELEQMPSGDARRRELLAYAETILFRRSLDYAAAGVISPQQYMQKTGALRWSRSWKNRLLRTFNFPLIWRLVYFLRKVSNSRYCYHLFLRDITITSCG